MKAIEKLSSLHRGGDTLRVFVYPPREDKVCRLLARGSGDSADRERVDFIKKYFNVEWSTSRFTRSMINRKGR
jgi:hypothetical protein